MRSREKPHMDKDVKVMSDRVYDASCTLTSLAVLGLQNFSA
jgi:hypothetical protein